MNSQSREMNLLQGPLLKNIIFFTIPIALSSILQQFFSATDTAIVGLSGDANALAAVGTNTEIVALIVTLSAGLSLGVNILVSKRIGLGRKEEIPVAVQHALFLAILIGIIGLLIGQLISYPLLGLIDTPNRILHTAALYLRIFFLGYPFLLLYDFSSAVLRAHGDSRYPFMALALSGIVNIGLNLFFVIVCGLGVAGVAIATDISNLLSALMVIRHLIRVGYFRPSLSEFRMNFSRKIFGEILVIGIPAAIQDAVFCFANIFLQASVNGFGEDAIAGNTIALNFEYFTYYAMTAFAQTATTFIGQNYAAGNSRRCRKIFGLCVILSLISSSIPIYTVVGLQGVFCRLFTSDAQVIAYATIRINCILVLEPLCNFFEIPAAALRGCDHPFYPAISTMLSCCVFRIFWICTIFQKFHTLPVLYYALPVTWCITIAFMGIGIWKNRKQFA